MRRILLAVLRDLGLSRGRTLAVALLLAAGVAVYAGMYAATDSLFATRDALFEEGRLADLEVIFVPEDAANVPDLALLEGVEEVQPRLVLPGHIPLEGRSRLPALLYFLDDRWPQRVNRLTLLAGRPLDPSRPRGALLERSLARYHGFRPGDPIEVRVGHKVYRLTVEGIVLSPEYLMTSSSGGFLIPSKGSLGVVFVSSRLLSEAMGFDLIDSLALRLAPGADRERVRADVERALAGRVRIERMTPRVAQPAYRYLQLDLEAFEQYVPAMLVVFAAVSALATFLTVSRLLHARRREIGTWGALGYSRGQIGAAFVLALLGVGAAGVALGLAGSLPLRDAFLLRYADAIGLPRVDRLLPAARVGRAVAAGLLLTLLATVLPLRRVLALRPVEALRPLPPAAAARRLPAPLQRATDALLRPLALRLAVRNLVRHAATTGATVSCMALSLAVAVAYFLSMTSLDRAADRFLGGARWDLAVDLAAPLWPEDVEVIAALPGVAAVEARVRGQVRLRRPGDDRLLDSTLTGTPPGATLWRTPHAEGKRVEELADGELVLEGVLARRLGVRLGDPVEVVGRERTLRATVAGLAAGLTGESSWARGSFAARALDLEEMATGVMVALEPGADEQAVLAALYDLPDVAAVTRRSGVRAAFHAILEEFWAIVNVAAGLAIAVAVLFVVASLTLTVLQREGEFATLEAIGFGRRTLRALLLTEAGLETAAAAVLAVPLAWGIATYLNGRMSEVWFEAPTAGRARDFLAVLLPALALGPAGALPGVRHVLRLDIAETVRRKTAD